jgi:hypothetical protein
MTETRPIFRFPEEHEPRMQLSFALYRGEVKIDDPADLLSAL